MLNVHVHCIVRAEIFGGAMSPSVLVDYCCPLRSIPTTEGKRSIVG